MNKNTTLALICASIFLLQGCASTTETSDSVVSTETTESKLENRQSPPVIEPVQRPQLTSLQRCLNDASTLIKLNNRYQKNYNELYILINDAKLYASLSGDTSDNVRSMIAPLFEYEINSKCNYISQLLIDAFRDRIRQATMLNGRSR